MQFKNRLAVVTGGASGIGKGVSNLLLERGARIAAIDLNEKSLQAEIASLKKNTENISTFVCDVTNRNSLAKTVNSIESELGPIEILVNAAGVIAAKGFEDTLISRIEDWDLTYSVNVKGTVIASELIAENMKLRRRGKIVNIASHGGRRGAGGSLSAYTASKAAVIHYTQSLAIDMAPHNINVNSVCPGTIWTPMWEQIAERRIRSNSKMKGMTPREVYDKFIEEECPMKKEQTVEDVAKAVAFFASEDANVITGQSLNVNGGTRMD